MKKTIFLVSMLFVITICSSQKKSSIDILNVSDIAKLNTKDYKGKISVDVLVLGDGTELKKGSELLLGRPSNSDDKTVENTAVNFTQINCDRHSFMVSEYCEGGLHPEWIGVKILVDNMNLQVKKKNVIVNFTLKDGGNVGSGRFGHILNLGKALSRREVLNPGEEILMTREEALEALTDANELYKLEVLTKAEYDSIRMKLSPILKN